MTTLDSMAGQQAAMDAFTGKRKPAKPTMTTGQVLTGQMAQFDPKKSQDSAGGMGGPSPNVDGVATGAGSAGAEAARQKIGQAAGGLGNMMGGAGVQPPPAPPPAPPPERQGAGGLSGGYGGGAGDSAVEGGNASGETAVEAVERAEGGSSGRSKGRSKGRWDGGVGDIPVEVEAVEKAGATNRRSDEPGSGGGKRGGWSNLGDNMAKDREKQLEAEREGMTEAQQRLWDALNNEEGGMSKEERDAKMAALAANRDAARERLNRAQGAAGGESALQVIGGGAADYNYQQGVGTIDKEAYDRKMEAINQSAGLAESAAAREERSAKVFQDAADHFNEKGWTLTADGRLLNQDGKPVKEEDMSAEDKQFYETFKNDAGSTTPGSTPAQEQAWWDEISSYYADAIAMDERDGHMTHAEAVAAQKAQLTRERNELIDSYMEEDPDMTYEEAMKKATDALIHGKGI